MNKEWPFNEQDMPSGSSKVIPVDWKAKNIPFIVINGSTCWCFLLPKWKSQLDDCWLRVSGPVKIFMDAFKTGTYKQLLFLLEAMMKTQDGISTILELAREKESFCIEDYRLSASSSELDRYIVRRAWRRYRKVSLKFFMDWHYNVRDILRQSGLSDDEILTLFRKKPLDVTWFLYHSGATSVESIANNYLEARKNNSKTIEEE